MSGQLGEMEFVRNLVEVCKPFDDYTNDPRMEAAYYLSLAPIGSLVAVAPDLESLLRLPLDGETMDSSISFHLVQCVRRLVAEAGLAPSPDLAHLVKEA